MENGKVYTILAVVHFQCMDNGAQIKFLCMVAFSTQGGFLPKGTPFHKMGLYCYALCSSFFVIMDNRRLCLCQGTNLHHLLFKGGFHVVAGPGVSAEEETIESPHLVQLRETHNIEKMRAFGNVKETL